MAQIKTALDPQQQKITVEALQASLIDLIDLSLAAKQVHWNIVGPHFRSVHLQLDELVAAARSHADTIAERAVALGGQADGRAETVASERSTRELPSGQLREMDGVELITVRLRNAIDRIRGQMRATEEPDPPSQDLLNSVVHDLEEQYWMFQALAA